MTPSILTIAGSDPSGGAGIQADLKTFTSLSSYGASVITALTVQNTQGVTAVHEIPAQFVADQITSVVTDIPPNAIKTGMLASEPVITAIARTLSSLSSSSFPLVIDPVTISTSGHTLLPADAINALKTNLVPLGTLLTPNILEAQALLGDDRKIEDIRGMMKAGKDLAALGCKAVLVKGGHLPLESKVVRESLEAVQKGGEYELEVVWPGKEDVLILERATEKIEAEARGGKEEKFVVDVLLESLADGKGRFTVIVDRVIDTSSTHGTGCTLSAAIAVFLGRGLNVRDATLQGIKYTHTAIATAYPLGKGHGPLNHIHAIAYRPLPPPTVSDPHPFTTHLISSIRPLWDAYVNHPFVIQLSQGTLDRRRFEHYLRQDYRYLQHYARAHGLAASKTTDMQDIAAFSAIALHIAKESKMHIEYCADFGIDIASIIATPEAPGTSAYALYILDCGQRGSLLDLVLAVASCSLGYGEVGMRLAKQFEAGEAGIKMEGNIYAEWMKTYNSDDFLDSVGRTIDSLENRLAADPPSEARLAELTKIWEDCTRLEIGFWDGAMNLELDDLPQV